MAQLNVLMLKVQMYWQIPGVRVGLGVVLLAVGIIMVLLPEGRKDVGLVLTVVGLGTLLHGASEVAGLSRRRPTAAPPTSASAPPKSPSFMHIQVAPPTGGK